MDSEEIDTPRVREAVKLLIIASPYVVVVVVVSVVIGSPGPRPPLAKPDQDKQRALLPAAINDNEM